MPSRFVLLNCRHANSDDVNLQADDDRYIKEESLLNNKLYHALTGFEYYSLAHCPYKPVVYNYSLCTLTRDSALQVDSHNISRPIYAIRRLDRSRLVDTLFSQYRNNMCIDKIERVSED